MILQRIEIENYRGIRHLALEFSASTTVLIGENDHGKSSVIDALGVCLGARPDRPHPFQVGDFRIPDPSEPDPSLRPIRIEITFVESDEGACGGTVRESLAPVAFAGADERNRIVLRVVGHPSRDSDPVPVEWSFLDATGKALPVSDLPVRLGRLRETFPFVLVQTTWASRGSRNGQESPDRTVGEPDPSSPGPASEAEDLEDQIESAYRALVTSRRPTSVRDLGEGLEAAMRYVDLHATRWRAPETDGNLLEELAQAPRRLALRSERELMERLRGSGVHSLALLMLLGAFLEARGETAIAIDACPIVAIEEPETHLHAITLASLWGLIEGVNAQKVVTTNSEELLSSVPLDSLRRLRPGPEGHRAFRLGENTLTLEDMRRIGYHLRVRRGGAFFARCWLLVEGETECWLLPELARQHGYEFPVEGIRCIEYAQCGPKPLLKLANDLGIEWHLLSDGDSAGKYYAESARAHLGDRPEADHITKLRQKEIEEFLWDSGYESVYREVAKIPFRGHTRRGKPHGPKPAQVIDRAVRMRSKPYLALAVVEAASEPDSPGVPEQLQNIIDTVVRLARTADPW